MLKDFLNNKPIYYKKIDFTRFPRAFAAVAHNFTLPPAIHVVGTNGKGSTGRFLAQILRGAGRRVGHYTSPHIFDFAERFWLDGAVVGWDALNAAHARLRGLFADAGEAALGESLSYFEWATLLAAVVFGGCDEVVLEAGMGGEFDATNEFAKKMSLFTPIGLDHCEMLGATLGEIAATKLRSVAAGTRAVFAASYALPELAWAVAGARGAAAHFTPHALFEPVAEYVARGENRAKFEFAPFLQQNLNHAYFAAKILGAFGDCGAATGGGAGGGAADFGGDLSRNFGGNSGGNFLNSGKNSAQKSADLGANLGEKPTANPAQNSNLAATPPRLDFTFDLRGRCEMLAPNVIADVGHNPHAARAVAAAARAALKSLKVNLVYNAFADKDVAGVLREFAPLGARVLVYDYAAAGRELAGARVAAAARELGLECGRFDAAAGLRGDEGYVVFGSFLLVEQFLREVAPSLRAE